MHMRWDSIHKIRGSLPPDTIIGYEFYNDDGDMHIFVCAYHEDPDYFEDWTPVTVKDTHTGYYQCDRMGCEVGYWQEPMEE